MKQWQLGSTLLLAVLVAWGLIPEQKSVSVPELTGQVQFKPTAIAAAELESVNQLLTEALTDTPLLIDAALRRSFDAWLATASEDDFTPAWHRLLAYAELHEYTGEVLRQLEQLFKRYIGYRNEINAFQFPTGLAYLEQLELAMDVKSKAAKRWLSAIEIDGLLGEEFTHDQQALERAKAAQQLQGEDEQISWLASYLDTSDEATQKAFQPSLQLAQLSQHLASGIENHADSYDQATLKRLTQLEHKRTDWRLRVSQYVAEQQQLAQLEGMDQQQRDAQLQQFAAELFTPQEQRRLAAYMRNPALLEKLGIVQP